MKIYNSPEIIFQSASSTDQITVSVTLFSDGRGNDSENTLRWGDLGA